MRVKLTAIGVMLLVAAVGAGCGGGKKSVASATTAATSATTSAESTTTVAATFASAKNCQQLMALGAKMSQALQSSSGNATGSLGDEANVFKALAAAAPSEIRGDFQTFADAFSSYSQALEKAGFKAGKVPTAAQIAAMAQAAKSFSQPKLQAAERHLSAWARKNCGIGVTTTG